MHRVQDRKSLIFFTRKRDCHTKKYLICVVVFTYIDGLAEGGTANFNNFLASIDTEFKQISRQFKSYRST
jgi:hypothetical protein